MNRITNTITDDELRAIVRENAVGIKELREEIKKLTAGVNDKVGNLRNSYGKVMELVVVPSARSVLRRLGHDYDVMIPNMIELNPVTKKKLYEVDLFLLNGTEAMAMDVKGRLAAKDVAKHIERLKTLRADEFRLNIKGKALYGCLASISIDKSAKKLALDAGIYVLEIIEDQKRMNAFAPPAGKVGRW